MWPGPDGAAADAGGDAGGGVGSVVVPPVLMLLELVLWCHRPFEAFIPTQMICLFWHSRCHKKDWKALWAEETLPIFLNKGKGDAGYKLAGRTHSTDTAMALPSCGTQTQAPSPWHR
eukprot:1160005-Pelagomonas_calceolata.AAC.6